MPLNIMQSITQSHKNSCLHNDYWCLYFHILFIHENNEPHLCTFVCITTGREDEQQQLENRPPGGVWRRRKQRVWPCLPSAGTRSCSMNRKSIINIKRILCVKPREKNLSYLFPLSTYSGVFPRLCLWRRVQQHLCLCAHYRPLCQPAVLRIWW